MKSFLIILGVLCLAIAAIVIHADLKHDESAPVAAASTANEVASAPSSATSAAAAKLFPHRPAFFTAASHPSSAPAPDPIREAVDFLVSPGTTFKQREAVWHQLNDLDQLDAVIAALKEGATNHPDSPEYEAALGKANLQKAAIVSQNGGSINELGILGMTADQSFDAALKIDPSNWNAQFYKAVAMSYWPASLSKGDEVVQRFSGLIDQQASQSARPEFALPYVALGQQYQKLGQTDNAVQTWQAGAARFPNDPTLQQKLAAASAAH
jgi:tetratricopeptide (TPR) repeat protein